ncbi:MAG: hypothetical protein NTZ05_23095 [Chloroflexi bacterium]|nr:hypothetical protein [Chloroflexota bacterium]
MSLLRPWFRLHDRAAADPALGPKWSALARLAQHGFPVPDAALLSADLFDLPQDDDLKRAVAACLPLPDVRDLVIWQRAAEGVRRLLEATPAPPALDGPLAAALDAIGPGPFAVRAAPIPHPGEAAVPTGLFDSYLNLIDPQGAVNALRSVWASRWGAAAQQERSGRPFRRFGVIVQQMALAEVSGVALSHAGGARREAVMVLAVWGLGEALASGIVAPDTFWASRSDGELLDLQREPRGLMAVARADGGVAVIPVPTVQQDLPTLRPRQVQELALLVLDCEQELGGPQTVEWAMTGGRFTLLGSRPQGSG